MTANEIEAPGDLCVITAADIEFNTVAKVLAAGKPTDENGLKVLRGRYRSQQMTLLKTEIGAAGFADKLQAHLAQNRYAALIVIGLAGALDPALRTGDVVLYDRCLDGRKLEATLLGGKLESRSIHCDDVLGQKLFEGLSKQGLRCQRGAGLLVERVVIEAQQKLTRYEQTKAAAVDMETYLVLATAAECQLPCAAVRVVLDEAASDLPDFNAGLDAAGRVQLWPTLLALARRPRAALRFLRALRPALRNLTRAAEAVFKAFNSR